MIQRCDFIWCDSKFNLETLKKLCKVPSEKAVVIPIQKQFSKVPFSSKINKTLAFIGRWVPNKKLEDLLFTLYFLKKLDPSYSLQLIGKPSEVFALYNQKIKTIVQELDLEKNIYFFENISEEEKEKLLHTTQAFLCMSEHEGFCIPILESMAHNVLVFAYSQEAVVETCRGAGILFKEKDFSKIAYTIHFVLENQNMIESLLKVQERSLEYYNLFDFKKIFHKLFL